MSPRNSALTILREGVRGHRGWPQAWRKAKPKPAYDLIVVGGGGHGLATAYYLAKNHGRTRVAVIEKGWLGGGNTGRNTTIVRSNYFYPEFVALYDMALRLYERLSRDLNFNVMLSQRGILTISHTPAQLEIAARLANAMQINGVDAELWGPDQIRERLPLMTQSLDSRYLPNGGVWQPRGGTARHDAVAWGFARAADSLGVDIIETCEVTGFIMQNGACVGVETNQGEIRAEAVGVAVAGHSSQLMAKVGVKLPILSYTLQAMVSESVKPCLDIVLLQLGTGVYASQSDKGEIVFGGALDRAPSYGQRGNPPVQEVVVSGLTEMFPAFGQLKLMRQWGGIVDVVPDSSPIIGPSPTDGISSIAAGAQEDSRRSRPAACCSPISWRPARTIRSAVRSTSTASPPGASSTRPRAPASHIDPLPRVAPRRERSAADKRELNPSLHKRFQSVGTPKPATRAGDGRRIKYNKQML